MVRMRMRVASAVIAELSVLQVVVGVIGIWGYITLLRVDVMRIRVGL